MFVVSSVSYDFERDLRCNLLLIMHCSLYALLSVDVFVYYPWQMHRCSVASLLLICLFVCRITQKVMNRLVWNFHSQFTLGLLTDD